MFEKFGPINQIKPRNYLVYYYPRTFFILLCIPYTISGSFNRVAFAGAGHTVQTNLSWLYINGGSFTAVVACLSVLYILGFYQSSY